ncbi:MAG TPA: ATP-binding cassette domain-containing protein [Polyangiaceae bacterium]
MITLDGVSKSYGAARALGPVTLDVPEGRRLAIVGPSGCGKSTLLRIILGLVRPDAGHVRVRGETVGDATKLGLRRRIGYVVQEGGLFPHLTARDNVTLVARHLAWEETRIDARVDELSAMTGIDAAMLARWPLELSGGQRQRVGVMRALFLDPDVVLLDEPLGALDPVTRRRMQGELDVLFRSLGKTVVLVTHDVPEATRLAEEAVVMRDGLVVQRGTIAAMGRAPADSFVGELLSTEDA